MEEPSKIEMWARGLPREEYKSFALAGFISCVMMNTGKQDIPNDWPTYHQRTMKMSIGIKLLRSLDQRGRKIWIDTILDSLRDIPLKYPDAKFVTGDPVSSEGLQTILYREFKITDL